MLAIELLDCSDSILWPARIILIAQLRAQIIDENNSLLQLILQRERIGAILFAHRLLKLVIEHLQQIVALLIKNVKSHTETSCSSLYFIDRKLRTEID